MIDDKYVFPGKVVWFVRNKSFGYDLPNNSIIRLTGQRKYITSLELYVYKVEGCIEKAFQNEIYESYQDWLEQSENTQQKEKKENERKYIAISAYI